MDRLSPGLGALLSLLALCSFLLVVREQMRVVAGWLRAQGVSEQIPSLWHSQVPSRLPAVLRLQLWEGCSAIQ